MLGTRLKISAYARRRRGALLDLASRSQWTHEHLDWHTTSQWLEYSRGPAALAWHGDLLVGFIALSPPIDGASWIRLLCIRDGSMPGLVVRELWRSVEAHCARHGITSVSALMIANWLPGYLLQQGFAYEDDVVTMSRIGRSLPKESPVPARVRAAESEDCQRIIRVDRLAFASPWQLAQDEIRQAWRAASSATVAVVDGELIAYQFSTCQEGVGHLARLAVHPAHRRRRIASALLRRLLIDFETRDLAELTVNTQASNSASQRLYEQFGFFRNGKDYEMWRKRLG